MRQTKRNEEKRREKREEKTTCRNFFIKKIRWKKHQIQRKKFCPPCKIEHPLFFKIKEEHPNLFIIGVDYKDSKNDALDYLKKDGNPYDFVGYDKQGLIGLEFGVFGLPETFLINKKGKIIYKHLGPLDKKIIENDIYPLLN